MTVSMRAMSAGAGVEYLLSDIAAGDGGRSLLTPLTRYYAETGYPPGRWRGSGVVLVGLAVGDVVTEEQLRRLLGEGRDPVSGEKLGRAFPVYKTVAERVAARVARLDKEIAATEGRDPGSAGAPTGRPGPGEHQRSRQDGDRQDGGREVTARPVTAADRAAAVERIEAEESARELRRAVAGFDFTFSPSKSVSVLWALADARVQAIIVEARWPRCWT